MIYLLDFRKIYTKYHLFILEIYMTWISSLDFCNVVVDRHSCIATRNCSMSHHIECFFMSHCVLLYVTLNASLHKTGFMVGPLSLTLSFLSFFMIFT